LSLVYYGGISWSSGRRNPSGGAADSSSASLTARGVDSAGLAM
jgi:hypothetical protein